MDPKKFKEKIQRLQTQRELDCEYCPNKTPDRAILCQAYSLKQNPYYKHLCASCDQVLFDGSKKFKKYRLIVRDL